MTRARERLLLSGAVDFERWPRRRRRRRRQPRRIAWLAARAPGCRRWPRTCALAAASDAAVHDLHAARGAATALVRCWLSAPAHAGTVLRLGRGGADGAGTGRTAWATAASGGGAARSQPPRRRPPTAGAHDRRGAAGRRRAAPAAGRSPARCRSRSRALSYTSLSELERCGYRYYLERVLGLPRGSRGARAGAGQRGVPRGARARDARAPAAGVARLRAPAAGPSPERGRTRRARARACAWARDERERDRGADRSGERAPAAGSRRGRARACAASIRSRSRSARRAAADHRRDRPARRGGRRRVRWCSTTRATGSARRSTWRRWSSATTASSACCTRSRCCATARAQVEIVHWFLRAPARAGRVALRRGRARELEARLAARIARRASARGFSVSPRPTAGCA